MQTITRQTTNVTRNPTINQRPGQTINRTGTSRRKAGNKFDVM